MFSSGEKRLPRLMALLQQRPHGKAVLQGDCEGVLRFYQSRQGVLTAAEFVNVPAESPCFLRIADMEFPLPLCQRYGCMIFLSDDFSLHEVTGTRALLFDGEETLLAQGIIRSWDSL